MARSCPPPACRLAVSARTLPCPRRRRRRRAAWTTAGAALILSLGACTGHPSEGTARGAATGVAGALVFGTPAVVAVPAGAAAGATANSFWQAWNRNKTRCAQLSRCVY